MDNTNLKNELIFSYAAGTASLSKSLIAAMYLFLNSSEKKTYEVFESMCGEYFNKQESIVPKFIKAQDCMVKSLDAKKSLLSKINSSPIENFIKSFENIKWKKIFKGFEEYEFSLGMNETAKLFRMAPGVKVPKHSHKGNEYILVLEGSLSDEYGTYEKGNLQINEKETKHTPVADFDKGCICLTTSEENIILHGPLSPLLNLIIFIKSFFSKLLKKKSN